MWNAHPAPPAKPGRFRKMHASSCRRVRYSSLATFTHTGFLRPFFRNCQSCGVSFAATLSTCFMSFLSEACAP